MGQPEMLSELGTQETGRSQAKPKTDDHCVMANGHDNRPVILKSVNCDHQLYTVGMICPIRYA